MQTFDKASAYSAVGMETGTLYASPHKLVSMLLEGAIDAMSQAAFAITSKNDELKIKKIRHALNIVTKGLKAPLDMKIGGELASNLFDVYSHIEEMLIAANLGNDVKPLTEASALLKTIKDGWDGIAPS